MSVIFSTKANSEQLDAIQSTEGPLLIIAGPGSGKTFTLVERIVYLITQKEVAPENLLVMTFTEKAAQELTTRISNRLNALNIRFNLNEMYLGTIHSICLRWLEEYREFTRLKRNFIMMDEFDQKYFIYERISEYEEIPNISLIIGEPDQSAWSKTEELVKWINTVSEEALDIQKLITAPDLEVQVLGQCAALYQKHLEENNALDFSTIQYEALHLLQTYPEVRAELKQKMKYLMVDEYQDTNTIQEIILFLLAEGDAPNLCVVGDDDQGLYRFRGATIRNILEFKDHFPPGVCKQVNLTINYRSHPEIISFYNRFMAAQDWTLDGKVFRFEKEILPRDEKFPSVPAVIKVSSLSQEGYHEEVLKFLQTLRDQGHLTDWNQVAFLFRSVKNPKAVALSRFLENHGITVYSPRSNQFFEREEIRLMIGALIFLFPQFADARKWKADAYLQIWDYYDNDCFDLFATELRKEENADMLRWCRAMAKSHLTLAQNTDYAFSGLFYQLLRFPLFSQFLEENLLKGGINDSRAMRNLAILSQLLGKFEYLHNVSVLSPDYLTRNLRNLFNQFFRFLKEGGIDEYEDQQEYAPSGCVSFFTVHQSKGLEFPVVVVGSLEATPRKQFTRLTEILESGYLTRPPYEPLEKTKYYDFRRLFYTAFSRAQNLLVLACHEKEGRGRTPSAYFAEQFEELPSWHAPEFISANLPLEKIKDITLKQEYSFTSHLTLFENCAEQYRFYRELEFAPIRTNPILFGTLVHQTIEDIHKAVLRGEESKLSEQQVANWFDTNYAFLTKKERVYLASYVKNIALEQVLRYYRRNQRNWSRIKDSEVDVSLVKDEYILKGTIDLIVGENQTVELIDFKSEKKPDVNNPADREKLERYRRQLEVYAHIVEERTGHVVSKSHLYYTSEEDGNPYITYPKDSRAIETTIAVFDQVVHRIEKKDFSIAERPAKLCPACDMRFYCDARNWKFRKKS
jgi:DNA helicase-2/ATP-dependent DNA helicase PcrA